MIVKQSTIWMAALMISVFIITGALPIQAQEKALAAPVTEEEAAAEEEEYSGPEKSIQGTIESKSKDGIIIENIGFASIDIDTEIVNSAGISISFDKLQTPCIAAITYVELSEKEKLALKIVYKWAKSGSNSHFSGGLPE